MCMQLTEALPLAVVILGITASGTAVLVDDAGVLPDSPLSVIDRSSEKVRLMLQASDAAREQVKTEMARERLAEAEKLEGENADKVLKQYRDLVSSLDEDSTAEIERYRSSLKDQLRRMGKVTEPDTGEPFIGTGTVAAQ